MDKKINIIISSLIIIVIWSFWIYLILTKKEFPLVPLLFTPVVALTTGIFGTNILIHLFNNRKED